MSDRPKNDTEVAAEAASFAFAFDKRFEIRRKNIPDDLQGALIWVNDTLEMAHASAQQVFGIRSPGAAEVLGVYDRMYAEYLRLLESEAAEKKAAAVEAD